MARATARAAADPARMPNNSSRKPSKSTEPEHVAVGGVHPGDANSDLGRTPRDAEQKPTIPKTPTAAMANAGGIREASRRARRETRTGHRRHRTPGRRDERCDADRRVERTKAVEAGATRRSAKGPSAAAATIPGRSSGRTASRRSAPPWNRRSPSEHRQPRRRPCVGSERARHRRGRSSSLTGREPGPVTRRAIAASMMATAADVADRDW